MLNEKRGLSARLHRALDFALGVTLCSGFALVVQLFALAQAQLNLDARVLKVQRQRNQRISLLLGLAEQRHDFLFVHQQLALAQRVFVEDVSHLIRADVHALDKDFAVAEDAVRILQAYRALTNRLDLCAEQLNAAFISLLNEIIVSGFFVGGYLLCAFFLYSHGSDHPFVSVFFIISFYVRKVKNICLKY